MIYKVKTTQGPKNLRVHLVMHVKFSSPDTWMQTYGPPNFNNFGVSALPKTSIQHLQPDFLVIRKIVTCSTSTTNELYCIVLYCIVLATNNQQREN